MSNNYDIDYNDDYFDMMSDIDDVKERRAAFKDYVKETLDRFDEIIDNFDQEYETYYEMSVEERKQYQLENKE